MLFSAVISEHFGKNRMIIYVVAAKICLSKMCGFYWATLYIHHVPKKTCDYIFYNNFNNTCPITIIFGTVSSKSMCDRKMVSFSTSPI